MSFLDRLFPSPSSAAPGSPPKPPGPLRKPDGSEYELALYAYDQCPFCQRVYRTLSKLGIDAELRNTMRDRKHHADLIAATGRGTVPCLFIDGKPMHESAEIMQWLTARASEQPDQ